MYYHYFVSYCIAYDGYYIFKDTEATSKSKINTFEDYIDLKKEIAKKYKNVEVEDITIITCNLIRDEQY